MSLYEKSIEMQQEITALKAQLATALELLEPASEWMSADDLEWWDRYEKLREETK